MTRLILRLAIAGGIFSAAILGCGGAGDSPEDLLGEVAQPSRASASNRVSHAVETVSGGYAHTCALRSDGAVRCWGYNGDGELGDGTTVTRSVPALVGLPGYITALAAGYFHTCALGSNGVVACWGFNGYGQIGSNASNSYLFPVNVGGPSAVAIASGAYHSCAILEAGGQVLCWGLNSSGQLGNGTTQTPGAPVYVNGITGAVSLALGSDHSCAVLSNGTARCWGANGRGQLGDGTTVQRLLPVAVSGLSGVETMAAGASHTCAAGIGGQVRCWGDNTLTQLGGGTAAAMSATPVFVAPNMFFGGSSVGTVTALTAGARHTCALLANGGVKCWGDNTSNQLGRGAAPYLATQIPATVLGLTEAKAIGSGAQGGCAELGNGTLRCWGHNGWGQIGDGTTTGRDHAVPVLGSNGATAVELAINDDARCALRADGTVSCWQQGGPAWLAPIAGPVPFKDISVSYRSLWGLGVDGSLWTTVLHQPPTLSQQPGASNAVGLGSVFTVLSDGSVRALSAPGAAIPGNGAGVVSNAVAAVGDPEATGPGPSFSLDGCALLAGGTVQCWGDNTFGQLGDGTTTSSASAVTVVGLQGAVGIAENLYNRCALLADGTVRCWGRNHPTYPMYPSAGGGLGDGSTVSSSTPVQVTGITSAVQIAGGRAHYCALLANGTVRCWGSNGSGQIGNGSLNVALAPAAVFGLKDVVSLALSSVSSCALLSTGLVRCWGINLTTPDAGVLP